MPAATKTAPDAFKPTQATQHLYEQPAGNGRALGGRKPVAVKHVMITIAQNPVPGVTMSGKEADAFIQPYLTQYDDFSVFPAGAFYDGNTNIAGMRLIYVFVKYAAE